MAKMIRVCIALMILIGLPAPAFTRSSKSFPCMEGQHILPDALDIRDNEHALAVMRRHPELNKILGYLDESIEGDYIENTKTPGGRAALVIVVVVDSSDPRTGRATLSRAQAQAPRSVEDVGVRVVSGGGAFLDFGPILSEIDAPIDEDKVKGIVKIMTSASPMVSWISLHIDDSFLASSSPSVKDWSDNICATWNSRTVSNGPHTISVKSYGNDMREIVLGRHEISVTVAN